MMPDGEAGETRRHSIDQQVVKRQEGKKPHGRQMEQEEAKDRTERDDNLEDTSVQSAQMSVEEEGADSRDERGDQDEMDAKLYLNYEGGKVGMANLGNTCFMNAGLQALMHCPPVVGMFLTGRPDFARFHQPRMHQRRKLKYILVEEFQVLLRKVWSGKYRLCVPRDVYRLTVALNPSFRGFGQQDSQEFIRCLLNSMHEALMIKCELDHRKTVEVQSIPPSGEDEEQQKKKIRRVEEFSVISDLFEGRLRSDVKCSNCGNVSTVNESFMDLSLEIPKDPHLKKVGEERGEGSVAPVQQSFFSNLTTMIGLTSTPLHLETLLHSFCTSSDLKHQNQYRCDKCKQKVDANKVLSITKLPEILCIHIKRFSYSMYGSKVGRSITFKLKDLDMSPYLHSSIQKCDRPVSYDLYAVVRHSGGLSGGHYVTYAKSHITGRWFNFNDRSVTEVTPETVSNQQAYVLMYVRKPDVSRRRSIKEQVGLSLTESWNQQDLQGYFISRYWIRKCQYISDPGPIDNRSLCCGHGIPVQALLRDDKVAVCVSPKRWKVLHSMYGGGPVVRADSKVKCQKCELGRIRALEKKEIIHLEHTWQNTGKSNGWYIVSEIWMKSWREFILGGSARPGPISNESLFNEDGNPKQDLKPARDYRGLCKPVWSRLKEIYGGSSPTIRRKIDIYGPEYDPLLNEKDDVDEVIEDVNLDPTREPSAADRT
mmetsp:Transcript_21063/g.51529  ORF Transcript_21063/g.51529 Transcript_21063/m.51529 type:complete len:708 (+) Transcript_21063:130-2253(+)